MGLSRHPWTHYIKDGTMDHLGETTSRANTYRLQLAGANTSGSRRVDILTFLAWGCVFGVRQLNREWHFYLQENCTVLYADASAANAGTFATSLLIRLTRFFPGPRAVITETPVGPLPLVASPRVYKLA